jgi:RND family efflux transporter MFP subunit
MKKTLWHYRIPLGLTALLLLVALLLAAHYRLLPLARWTGHIVPRAAVTVTAVPIGTMNKAVPIVRTGTVASPASVPITADFAGRISEVYVTAGQAVKAGQPLAKLLGTAAPATNSGTAAPASQSDVPSPQSQTAYDQALKDYNRYQKLYEQGAIARRQVDNAAARLQALQGSSTSTPDTPPDNTNTTTVSSNSSTTITAPVNGIVTSLATATEQSVQMGQQLMVLDSGQVQVAIDIEQADLYLVPLGTPATITVAGQALLGQVTSIVPELGSNNMPLFHTHIKVTNDTSSLLKPGMSVNASINTGKSAAVVVVPATAIFQDYQGLNYIYLADNGKATRQQVTIGEPLGNFIEITAPLPEQALVITSNINDLSNGDAIVVAE